MDPVESRTALESHEIVLPATSQFAVGSYHRPLATPPNLRQSRLQLRVILNRRQFSAARRWLQ